MNKKIHVAVGIIFNSQQQILMALRPDHLHEGGKWEFPGGKVEAGETVLQALTRELHEEVAIDVLTAHSFLTIHHDYPEKSVLLDVWQVTKFSGVAHGKEGQIIEWVNLMDLKNLTIPTANHAIVKKLLDGLEG